MSLATPPFPLLPPRQCARDQIDASGSTFSASPSSKDDTVSIAEIMTVAKLVSWEAWDAPLELSALHFGDPTRPSLALERGQLARGSSWTDNVYPADVEKLRTYIETPDVVQTKKHVDYRLIVAEGELLWIRHWLLQRSAPVDGRRRLRGVLMPIAEQKQLEWECLRVSDRERIRIGQDLHDDLCQMLAGLAFMMHVIGQRVTKVAPKFGREIRELNKELQGATDRVRTMAHGLFPAQLDHSTLREMLTILARQSRQRFSLQLDLRLPARLPAHTPEQVMHVYRIGQEAVHNAVRHGAATGIRVAVTTTPDSVQISIEDNGRGFSTASAQPEGIGMHVMQYRARVLGGVVHFKKISPRGVAVLLRYPVLRQPSRRLNSTVTP